MTGSLRRWLLAAAMLGLCLMAPAPGQASVPAPAATPEPIAAAEPAAQPVALWAYTLYKTLTYEVLGSLGDGLYYATFIDSADIAGAGLFTAASVAVSTATYYAHELAWTVYGPTPEEYAAAPVETGLLKTISYRVMGTARNFALGFAFTGDPWASAAFALASNLYDPFIYLANEYVWNAYGPPVPVQR